jgi:hypothetical protein
MHTSRIALILLAAGLAYSGLLVWRLIRPSQSIIAQPVPPFADVNTMKSDLCNLFRVEGAFFDMTGRYATENDLQSSGNSSLRLKSHWPYHYSIYVAPKDHFMILATGYGPPGEPSACRVYRPTGSGLYGNLDAPSI